MKNLYELPATSAKKHASAAIHEFSYSFVQSLSGLAVTVVPYGKTSEGMPIGIQITALRWQDHISLAVTNRLQTIFGVP